MGVANYSVPHIRADRDHEAYKVINLLQGQREAEGLHLKGRSEWTIILLTFGNAQ